MRNKKRLLVAAIAASMCGSGHAIEFTNVYVFGDSLSDAGQYGSRFTTNPGFTTFEYLAQRYGFTVRPSTQGGTDYAYGGARVTSQGSYNPQATPVTGQITSLINASGGQLDPKQLGAVPANVMVVSYAPQIELLKRSALCITHAGLNTVLESLSNGVPTLALPITNDQPGVAARIANKKVGVVLSPDQASPANFVVAIKRVLEDFTFRDNVRRMQQAIRSTDGLSIAAGILERAFDLEERQGAA